MIHYLKCIPSNTLYMCSWHQHIRYSDIFTVNSEHFVEIIIFMNVLRCSESVLCIDINVLYMFTLHGNSIFQERKAILPKNISVSAKIKSVCSRKNILSSTIMLPVYKLKHGVAWLH